MSISILGALIHTDAEEAKRRILAALEKTRGDRKQAAVALDTTHRNFYRLIERLSLWSDIDSLMRDKGFEVAPGPPRKRRRKKD